MKTANHINPFGEPEAHFEEYIEMPLHGHEDVILFEEIEDADTEELTMPEDMVIHIEAPVVEEPPKKRLVPGSDVEISDEAKDHNKTVEKETDWESDRDPKHFMAYISAQYPGKIPRHDGKTVSGCERAIAFLNELSKEVSEATRTDRKNELDISKLEGIRVSIMNDVLALKKHMSNLKKKLSGKEATASLGSIFSIPSNLPGIEKESVSYTKKIASTAKLTVTISAFERAITGMIVNGTVSAGRPFEEVYEYVKSKFKLTDREELSIMQILMDMGYPIFKDRAIVPADEDSKESDSGGVDFMKNYFA